jgi:hypothetical protein
MSRIMVVEDSAVFANLLRKEITAKLDHAVILAGSARSLMSSLKRAAICGRPGFRRNSRNASKKSRYRRNLSDDRSKISRFRQKVVTYVGLTERARRLKHKT